MIFTHKKMPSFGSSGTGARSHPVVLKPVAAPILPSAGCLDQLAAIEQLEQRFADLNLVFLESGGDNLAATFSPELVDLTIYVIDVAGDKIPAKVAPELPSLICW